MGADCANSYVNLVSECSMNETLTLRLVEAKPCIPATEKSCALSAGNQSDFWVLTKRCTYQVIAFPIALEVLSVE